MSSLVKSPVSKNNLPSIIETMKSLQSVDEKVIPQKREMEEKSVIEKSDVPQLEDELLNKAKIAAQIDEVHLQTIAKKVKDPSYTSREQDEVVLDVRHLIYEVKEKYSEAELAHLPLNETYEKVAHSIKLLYLRPDFKKAIGTSNSETLNILMGALQNLVWQYSEAKLQVIAEDVQKYGVRAQIQFDKVMQLLYSIEVTVG